MNSFKSNHRQLKLIHLTLLVSFGFLACVQDKPSPQVEVDNNRTDKASPKVEVEQKEPNKQNRITQEQDSSIQAGVKEIFVSSKVPDKSDWILHDSINIPNFDPSGLVYANKRAFISDTNQKIVLRYKFEDGITDTILHDVDISYIGQRASRVLLPITNRDSVFVFMGRPELYKFDLGIPLDGPIGFDGKGLRKIVIVDQGNNRFVSNLKGTYAAYGGYGQGDGEFDAPTLVHLADDRFYIIDAGNRRIQIFDFDCQFIKTFGEAENFSVPAGIASDSNYLFVSDSEKGVIYVYNLEGELQYIMSAYFDQPADIYFRRGYLYIADKQGADIKILTNSAYDDIRDLSF